MKENMFGSSVTDDLKSKTNRAKKKTVTNFVPPKVNIQASDYIEIINCNACVVYPSSMHSDLCEDDIKSPINSDTTLIRELQKFPCHPRRSASNLWQEVLN